MATILGIISITSLGIVVYMAYLNGGEIPVGYGFTGLLAAVYSLVGLILGIVTVQDKDYYRLFPWLGILSNLTALVSMAAILYFS